MRQSFSKLFLTSSLLSLTLIGIDSAAASPQYDSKINGVNIHDSRHLHNAKLSEVVSQAKRVATEERGNSGNRIVDYILVDGENIFHYVDEANQNPDLYVYSADSVTASQTLVDNIENGIGGRAKINYSSPSSTKQVSFSLYLATSSEATSGGLAKSYSGVNGTNGQSQVVEADLGLQFGQSVLGDYRWTPVGQYKVAGQTSIQLNVLNNGSGEAYSNNGYVPGSTVQGNIWRNYNGTGTLRLSLSGTTICTDHTCSDKTQTSATNIIEVANSNINSTNFWKFLGVVAAESGKNKTVFSSIKVDDITKTPTSDGADYATITTTTGGVTIVTNH